MSRQLQADGYSVWLDRDQIPISLGLTIESSRLKQIIEKAVKRSKWLVFFETFAESEISLPLAVTVDGGVIPSQSDAFNWQEFERSYSNRLVYVYPSRGTIEFPKRQKKILIEDMNDIVEALTNIYQEGLR